MRTTSNSVTRRRLPRRLGQLFAGLLLYGASMALMVDSGLGLTSWDVFHQGVSKATGLSFGLVVALVGIPVLLLWIPLRQRPGFGTVANLIVIGFVADATLAILPPGESMAMRFTYLVAGILLNGVATGMYIGAHFGPGPRDGLMTGIVRRFPRLSLRLVRTAIEVSVLVSGFLLGGTAGIGTVAYALAIGPLVQIFLPMFEVGGRATRQAAASQPDLAADRTDPAADRTDPAADGADPDTGRIDAASRRTDPQEGELSGCPGHNSVNMCHTRAFRFAGQTASLRNGGWRLALERRMDLRVRGDRRAPRA